MNAFYFHVSIRPFSSSDKWEMGNGCAYLGGGFRHERFVKLEHGELSRVPKLVAELAVSLDAQNLEIDVTPYSIYRQHK